MHTQQHIYTFSQS